MAAKYFLVRHGDAGEAIPLDPVAESERPLTAQGRYEAHCIAQYIANAKHKPTCVYSSPLTRTRQTGDIIAGALGMPNIPDPRFADGTTARQAIASLLADEENPLIVTHDHVFLSVDPNRPAPVTGELRRYKRNELRKTVKP